MPYRIARNGNTYSDPLSFTELLGRVKFNGTFWGDRHRCKGPGDSWTSPSHLPYLLWRLSKILVGLRVGEYCQVAHGTQRPKGEVQFHIKKVRSSLPLRRPPWADTYLGSEVNDRIKKVAYASYGFDDQVDCLGTQVCKVILGTNEWSQHSYGNAIDMAFRIAPPAGVDLPRQDKLADYLVLHAEELEIEHVISRDMAWTRGSGWNHYSGEYHYHVHVDCNPQGVGTPGCAR